MTTATLLRLTRHRAVLSTSAAAVITLVATMGADAQTVSTETRTKSRQAFTETNPCNGDVVNGEAKVEIRQKEESNKNGFRNLFEIRQDGEGIASPSYREYDFNAFDSVETRSSERVERLTIRQRTRLTCLGSCRPSPMRDDFFSESRLRCDGPANDQDCRFEQTPAKKTCR